MPKKREPSVPRTSRYKNHKFMNPDGSVDGERLLRLVRETPGVLDLIIAHELIKEKKPAFENQIDIHRLVDGISHLLLFAAYGDKEALLQLHAIEKLTRAALYEIPLSKIEEIVEKYHTRPPLARGWELRRLMYFLASVVEPLKRGHKFAPNHPVVMREGRPGIFVGLADLARKYIRRNSTLQSLAIQIYLKQLQDEGVTGADQTITERSLKRDLAEVEKWERNASQDDKFRRGLAQSVLFGDTAIAWCGYSQGWKERRKKKKRGAKSASN